MGPYLIKVTLLRTHRHAFMRTPVSVLFYSLSHALKTRLIAYSVACTFFALLLSPQAQAAHDVRTLTLYNTHSGESVTATFRINGRYLAGGLRQLNWLLRDWRYNSPAAMDPRLYDLLWTIQRLSGSRMPIHVLSGYRSPMTNALLRRSSNKVAQHSQHITGRALDFYLPDVPMSYVRAIAMRLQRGGVGYYPHSRPVFVHVDVGGVRAWPRMTREELLQIFPDGRTVHLPSNSGPLPGYLVAKAEILAQGGAEERGLTYAHMDTGPIMENGTILTQFVNHPPPSTAAPQVASASEKSLLRRVLSKLSGTSKSDSIPEATKFAAPTRGIPNLLKVTPEEAEDSDMDGQEAPAFAMPVERPFSAGLTIASLAYKNMPIPRPHLEDDTTTLAFSHSLPKARPDRASAHEVALYEEGTPDNAHIVLASLLNSIQVRNETTTRGPHKGLPSRRLLAARKIP